MYNVPLYIPPCIKIWVQDDIFVSDHILYFSDEPKSLPMLGVGKGEKDTKIVILSAWCNTGDELSENLTNLRMDKHTTV